MASESEGIVEDVNDPSPEEIERFAAASRERLPEFDLASVLREEISEGLERLQETLLSDSLPPVESVVLLSSRDEASDQDLDVLLEVEIEKIDVEGFGLTLTNELQAAAETLADDIVNAYWTYSTRAR